jgi:hypothetical protein
MELPRPVWSDPSQTTGDEQVSSGFASGVEWAGLRFDGGRLREHSTRAAYAQAKGSWRCSIEIEMSSSPAALVTAGVHRMKGGEGGNVPPSRTLRHSARSASTGSTRDARRAGTQVAAIATKPRSTAVPPKVRGSVALTP